MDEGTKKGSAFGWILSQAGDHRKQYVLCVIYAIIGVAFSVAPYIPAIGIVRGIMAGSRDMNYFLSCAGLMALFWVLRVLFHSLSTATSHRATFAVLGQIRKRGLDKLSRMPLGSVLTRGSGPLKNIS